LTLIFIVFRNLNNPWGLVLLSGLLFLSFVIKQSFFYGNPQYRRWEISCLVVDLAIVFLIGYFSTGSSYQIYYLVLIAYVALSFSVLKSAILAVGVYSLYLIELFWQVDFTSQREFIVQAFFNSLSFIAVVIVMYGINYLIKQNQIICETTRQLRVKTVELEETYNQLQAAYQEVEEMTIKKERHRMTRKLHDTLGHTLSTVLVEIEAGKRLAQHDLEQGLEKVELAKQEVKKGLNGVRKLVWTDEQGVETMDFILLLKSLIKDTQQHAGVAINFDIDELPELAAAQEKTLYRALQEGLTNGIRHGASTAFVFKLKCMDDQIMFSLEDNGTGCSSVVPGFGLQAMEERVNAQGGQLEVGTELGQGFYLTIKLPIIEEN
jgi:signal transduction histidine kinase